MNAGLFKVSVLHSDDRVTAHLFYTFIVEKCLQKCIENKLISLQKCIENKLISILSDLEKHPN